ncbi:MAG: TraR/DksA C4-type zinc finger protein [Planctomycetaceae bacterium]|nr:TraR/DksA C4-type zinc finger protein [Planctomycetaceae bacterium]
MPELYQVQAEGETITFDLQEIQNYKRQLIAKRHELLETIEQVKPIAERPSAKSDDTGDISSVPFHQADIGTDMYQQELNQMHLEQERQLLLDIDNALEKIEAQRFGVCESDRKPIAKARLQAVPWARYCLDCERAIEAGQ